MRHASVEEQKLEVERRANWTKENIQVMKKHQKAGESRIIVGGERLTPVELRSKLI